MVYSGSRIGIGTTSPNFKLQVDHGTGAQYVASFRNTNDNLQVKIGTTTGSLLNIQGATISTNAAYNIALQAEGGNVGIGTTIPGATLDITGNVRTSTYYNFNGNASNPGDSTAAVYDQSGVGPTLSGLSVALLS